MWDNTEKMKYFGSPGVTTIYKLGALMWWLRTATCLKAGIKDILQGSRTNMAPRGRSPGRIPVTLKVVRFPSAVLKTRIQVGFRL